jgi:hypothetical protein
LSVVSTLAYWAYLSIMNKIKCCEYGPWGCIRKTLFATHQWAGVLHYTRLQRLDRDKHSTLLELVKYCDCGPWDRVNETIFLCLQMS